MINRIEVNLQYIYNCFPQPTLFLGHHTNFPFEKKPKIKQRGYFCLGKGRYKIADGTIISNGKLAYNFKPESPCLHKLMYFLLIDNFCINKYSSY